MPISTCPCLDFHRPPRLPLQLALKVRERCLIAAVILCASSIAATAHSDILFGIQRGIHLVSIDTQTLTGQIIGNTGATMIGGLAVNDVGRLYGLVTTNSTLIRIDRSTGAGSLVGFTGRPTTTSAGLAFDATSDVLYGTTTEGTGDFSDFLVTIDKSTAATSSVGNMAANAIVGMEFDSDGQLWGVEGGIGAEQLVRIDKLTGAITVVSPAGLASFPDIAGLTIGPSGTFWAVDAGNRLVSIDPATGTGSVLGTINGLGSDLITGLSAVVPEPSAMVLNTIALFAHLVFGRRRCAASTER